METVVEMEFFYSLDIRLVDGQCDVLSEKMYRPFVVLCSFLQ